LAIEQLLITHATVGLAENSADYKLLMEKLSHLKDQHCWLICDCKEYAKAPRMTLVNLNGTLFLRRVPSSSTHVSTCPFKRQQTLSDPIGVKSLTTERSVWFGMYQALNALKVNASQSEEESGESKRVGARLSTLGRHLYTLLEMSRLNEWQANSAAMSTTKKLMEITQTIYIDANHRLADYFETEPHRIKARCYQLKQDQSWSKPFKPQLFFFFFIEAMEDKKMIQSERLSIFYRGRCYRSSGRLGKDSAPFMAFCTITDVGKQWFDVLDVFILPTLSSTRLFPVESHYERLVAQKCLEVIRSLHKKGLALTLIKPLSWY